MLRRCSALDSSTCFPCSLYFVSCAGGKPNVEAVHVARSDATFGLSHTSTTAMSCPLPLSGEGAVVRRLDVGRCEPARGAGSA